MKSGAQTSAVPPGEAVLGDRAVFSPAPRGPAYRTWTNDDIERIARYRRQGMTNLQAAAQISIDSGIPRSVSAVKKALHVRGLLTPEAMLKRQQRGETQEHARFKAQEKALSSIEAMRKPASRKPGTTLRRCLGNTLDFFPCGRQFASEGPHHRLCGRCRPGR